MAVGVFGEVGDGTGKKEAQAAEGRYIIEGIDGMAQDESRGFGRWETDRYKLLAEHIVCEIIIRRVVVADDTETIAKMPTDTPLSRCGGCLLDISITRQTDPLWLVG